MAVVELPVVFGQICKRTGVFYLPDTQIIFHYEPDLLDVTDANLEEVVHNIRRREQMLRQAGKLDACSEVRRGFERLQEALARAA